MDWYYYNRT